MMMILKMKTFLTDVVPLITSVWLITVGALFTTENLRSMLVFKAVPIVLAMFLALPIIAKYAL
jgi:hypothetical protein